MTPDGHGLLRRIIDRGFFCLSSEALCNDLWFGHFACHSTRQPPEGLRVAFGACFQNFLHQVPDYVPHGPSVPSAHNSIPQTPIPRPFCCRFSRQRREACRNAHHEVSPVLPVKDASTVLLALTKIFCVVSFAGREAVYRRGLCSFETESVGTTLSA